MDGSRMLRAVFKKDLTKREQIIVYLTLIVAVIGLIYQVPYMLMVRSVNRVQAKVLAMEQEVQTISLQIAEIKAHEAEIKAGLKTNIAGWDLVDRRGVILFLDDVSSEARKQGISLVAVHPTQEVDKDKYREVSMNLDLKGRYRELAEYFRQLENLSRIVSIRKIRVEACPDSASSCATQLEAVTYMEK